MVEIVKNVVYIISYVANLSNIVHCYLLVVYRNGMELRFFTEVESENRA